jgi:hypothetical protein
MRSTDQPRAAPEDADLRSAGEDVGHGMAQALSAQSVCFIRSIGVGFLLFSAARTGSSGRWHRQIITYGT